MYLILLLLHEYRSTVPVRQRDTSNILDNSTLTKTITSTVIANKISQKLDKLTLTMKTLCFYIYSQVLCQNSKSLIWPFMSILLQAHKNGCEPIHISLTEMATLFSKQGHLQISLKQKVGT